MIGGRRPLDHVPLRRARLEPSGGPRRGDPLRASCRSVFFHAHLACFDVPIMTMWIAVRLRPLARAGASRGIAAGRLAMGVVYGLTLETKHNAWFLPAVLVPHALFVHRRAILRAALAARGACRISGEPRVDGVDRAGGVLRALAVHLERHAGAPPVVRQVPPATTSTTTSNFSAETTSARRRPRSYLPLMVLATVPAVTLAPLLRRRVRPRRRMAGSRRLARVGARESALRRDRVARPKRRRADRSRDRSAPALVVRRRDRTVLPVEDAHLRRHQALDAGVPLPRALRGARVRRRRRGDGPRAADARRAPAGSRRRRRSSRASSRRRSR